MSPFFGQMRADFDQEKKRAVNVATRSLERDLERLKADHATEIEELADNHKQELADNKKKQWVICENHLCNMCKYVIVFFSAFTARQRPSTGAAGTLRTVPSSASRSTGTRSTRGPAEGSDDLHWFALPLFDVESDEL